ncbi:hypothetical protein MKK70_12860 [Methylobacterium sp. E-041]|uniref:hypothetical protein n=1 Tax=Methylobacterium sp. E-041 TaxID=2836573 RepID=UPI001FBA0A4F|nr:hypothetical protein [Methylobacterium sp. E-041]MCJ2106254.1 hypothetical protein [Methylobacterium sp. E-041]
MRATLNGLRKEMGLRGDEKFDPAMQDRLALRLYERRMAQARRKGGGDGAVLEALAQEWASFPTQSGQGYYPGQRAAVSTQQVLDAVRRQEASKTAPASATPQLPVMARGIGFNPGGFDVNAALRSAPMGTSSTTNNQSSMNVNSPTNVTINGVTDPQKAAEHFERAANRSNDLMVGNVQAAAR